MRVGPAEAVAGVGLEVPPLAPPCALLVALGTADAALEGGETLEGGRPPLAERQPLVPEPPARAALFGLVDPEFVGVMAFLAMAGFLGLSAGLTFRPFVGAGAGTGTAPRLLATLPPSIGVSGDATSLTSLGIVAEMTTAMSPSNSSIDVFGG